jgi:hypothetical protein
MRSLRFIFPLFAVVALFYWMRTAVQTSSGPSFFDIPKKLSEEKLTIEVRLHSTPDGAEVWSLSKSGSEDDRLYLQPASPSQTIPKDYYQLQDSGYVLKLYGSFYKGKGIPQEYFNIRPAPKRYPVFRYESLDVVKSDW